MRAVLWVTISMVLAGPLPDRGSRNPDELPHDQEYAMMMV